MKDSDRLVNLVTSDGDWRRLYRIGGVAALLAGVFFRRNIAAEIGLFSQTAPPVTVSDWFALLQSNRLLGLVYLNIFDIVNYALLGVIFLALYAVLKRTNQSWMAIAVVFSFLGIAIYYSSNTAFSMLPLSDQYAAATGEAEKSMLVAAGQALLVINRFTNPGAHPGTGGFLSLVFIAAAGMISCIVMLRGALFHRASIFVGILASAFDLAYCIAYVFVPAVGSELLAVIFLPAAGLLWMIWHILVGLRLYQLGKAPPAIPSN